MNDNINNTEITLSDYNFLKEEIVYTSEQDLVDKLLQQFQFDEDAREYIINKNICPECGQELTLKPQGYETYEYQGCELQERVKADYCENCGITYN